SLVYYLKNREVRL
nr:Chain B, WD repeat-containing protein 40A [Homo sapiens]